MDNLLLGFIIAIIIAPIGVFIGLWLNDNISLYHLRKFFRKYFMKKGRYL